MAADLSTSARQALIALMVSVEKAANPDLRKNYRINIDKATREELEKAKLIHWEKGPRNAIIHELTERGWARARQEFRTPPPEKVSGAWLLHYATLRHLDSLMSRGDYQLADVYSAPDPGPVTDDETTQVPVEDRIREAYADVAKGPGELVPLVHIRGRLADLARSEQDQILRDLDQRREIYLEADPARNELPPDALKAAIRIGGEDLHLIRIGRA